MRYINFDVAVDHIADQTYSVEVESDYAQSKERSVFPLTTQQIETTVKGIKQNLRNVRSDVHNIDLTTRTAVVGRVKPAAPADFDSIRQLGKDLYDFLFTKGNRDAFYRAKGAVSADREIRGMRINLKFDSAAAQLTTLPWELIYDEELEDFIAFSANTPIIRFVDLPLPILPLQLEPPLRILGMIANPDGDLNVQLEKERIEAGLKQVSEEKGIEVHLEWLAQGTWDALQSRLNDPEPWHIFHYIGHGGFDEEKNRGYLKLEDGEGGARNLAAVQLARMLENHPELRLAVLNACDGAKQDEADLFSSTAITIQRRGLPAVVAMQYPITDTAAIEFARRLYRSIVEGQPIDVALGQARQGLGIEFEDSFEWATPVLYMRTDDAILFDLPSRQTAPAPTADDSSGQTTDQSGQTTEPPAQTTEPPAQTTEPSAQTTEPTASTSNPNDGSQYNFRDPASYSLADIRALMRNRIGLQDVQDIAIELREKDVALAELSYDNLSGSTLSGKVLELLLYCERRGCLPLLVQHLQENYAYMFK